MNINLKTKFQVDETYECNEYVGTFRDKRIVYIDGDIKNIFDLDKRIYIRENITDGYKVEFDFNSNECKIYISEVPNYLVRNINVTECVFGNNIIRFAYSYVDENTEFRYELEYNVN